jgi:hypothetical protein
MVAVGDATAVDIGCHLCASFSRRYRVERESSGKRVVTKTGDIARSDRRVGCGEHTIAVDIELREH